MEILANNEESLIKEIENDINDFYDIFYTSYALIYSMCILYIA